MAYTSVEHSSMENRIAKNACIENTSTNILKDYDVFISHRGLDTKTGFVSFLHEALKRMGLQTFLDCGSIDIGEDAWGSIENAIRNSRIAVVVFSKRYLESPWCLRDLDAILETPGIKVRTIFYEVRPSDVRHPESGPLKDGFERLSKWHDRASIYRWRERLQEASKIMGWEHSRSSSRLESIFVSDVVATLHVVANKSLPLHVGDYVVGAKEVAENIINKLQTKEQVWMVGLWGMGGIGKTTLAKELYNQMLSRYESTCYIEDVSEMIQGGGVKRIQQQILKDLYEYYGEVIDNKFNGKVILMLRLRKTQFLLDLDNVQHDGVVEEILSREMFEAHSMCIVTSRNRKVFETSLSSDHNQEVYIHNVNGLSIDDSEKVFKSLAFGWSLITKSELVPSIIKRCAGVPLVLKVIGALLGKYCEEDAWEKVMGMLNDGTIMDEKKIFDCLQLSYDALFETEKEMLLDIGCILIGERKDMAIGVWNSLNWPANLGIQSLIEKALITVDVNGHFGMHDHLRDMSRAIEKKSVPRTRMWMEDDLISFSNIEELPNSLQALNISSSSKGHILDLDVSHMNLRILLCNKYSRIIFPLPESMIWFRNFTW